MQYKLKRGVKRFLRFSGVCLLVISYFALLTNVIAETLLEMFEDANMIKIAERLEEVFKIEFIQTVELSKVIHTTKYAEFIELLNTINDYKNKFMTVDVL